MSILVVVEQVCPYCRIILKSVAVDLRDVIPLSLGKLGGIPLDQASVNRCDVGWVEFRLWLQIILVIRKDVFPD